MHTQTHNDDWKNNKLVEAVVIPLDTKLPVEISFYPSFQVVKKERRILSLFENKTQIKIYGRNEKKPPRGLLKANEKPKGL